MSEVPQADLSAMQVGFEAGHLVGDFEALREHGGDVGLALIDREMQSIYVDARGLVRGHFGGGRIHRHLERATVADTATRIEGSFAQELDRGVEENLTLERLQSPVAEGSPFFDTVQLAVRQYISWFNQRELIEAEDGFLGYGEHWANRRHGKDLVVVTTKYELANSDKTVVEESVPSVERFYYDEHGSRQYELKIEKPGPDDAETVHRVAETVRGSSDFLRADITDRLKKVSEGVSVLVPIRGKEPRRISRLSYPQDALRVASTTIREPRARQRATAKAAA